VIAGSAARPATSAASARSSARAICWAIPSSRIAPCSRWASATSPRTPWWHALLLRVQSVHHVRLPRGSRSQERLRAVQAAGARARADLQGRPGVDHAASHGRVPPRAHAQADRAAGLGEFNNVGPLTEHMPFAAQGQGAAEAARRSARGSVVKCGDRVRVGDLLAAPEQGKLGARIHASIDGVVRSPTMRCDRCIAFELA
jgi:biotin carboxyl carrier protein